MTDIATLTYADGWSVTVRGLLLQSTYANAAETDLTHAANNDCITAFARKAVLVFGDHPVRVVSPLRTTGRVLVELESSIPIRREVLPPVCCIADLAAQSVSSDAASELLLVWFQPAPDIVPIEAMIADLLGDFDWDAESQQQLF